MDTARIIFLTIACVGVILVFAVAARLIRKGRTVAAISAAFSGILGAVPTLLSVLGAKSLFELIEYQLLAALVVGAISLIYLGRPISLLLFSISTICALATKGWFASVFVHVPLPGDPNFYIVFGGLVYLLAPVVLAFSAIAFVDAYVEKRSEKIPA